MDQQQNIAQAPTPSVQPPPQSFTPVSFSQKQKKPRKRLIIISMLILLPLLLIASGGAYAYFVYLPQRPEMVLKKAVENFQNKPQQYKIEGRVDQGNGNLPDFNYSVELDGKGSAKATIDAQTFMTNPSVDVIVSEGRAYIQARNFYDRKQLSKSYLNYGQKGLQEYMAEFTEYSNLYANQEKWIEIPSYIFENKVPSEGGGKKDLSASLSKIDAKETRDGKTLQKYVVKTTFGDLISELGSIGGASSVADFSKIVENYDKNADLDQEIELTVWADVKAKVIERVEYSGRPFSDATLSLTIQRQEVSIAKPSSSSLYQTLSYGVAWSELVRSDLQTGKTSNDSQRIADLKGVKLAMEIYKAKNGEYPDRYSIAVQQEDFLNRAMPHVDHQLFIDPAGRRMGLNGSQYAYIPGTSTGDEFCGPLNGPKCEKFFVITTLDDGSEYQLNSD